MDQMEENNMEKRILIYIEEASIYLGIKKPTLYSWILQKKIPYIKLGRLVRFDLKEINTWLKHQSVVNK